MKDWLKKRLTPRKQQEDRWVTLAETIQTQWEENFDPSLERLENLRSYFRAHDDDLAKKLREMGDYFAADMPRSEDKPIAVAWRKLELEYKDLELILYSVFRRHYADLPVTWFPLFAPVNEAYGSRFKPAEGPWPERKNIPPDGWFLTSRGLLGTDFGHLLAIGLNKEEYLKKSLALLKRTKPLHIVYDGALWYIRFDIPFEADFSTCLWWERDCGRFELQFSVLGSRFDHMAADERYLDIQSALCVWERENLCAIPFIPEYGHTWRLDFFLDEGISADWLSADTVITGIETDRKPFVLAATYSGQKFHSFLKPAKAGYGAAIANKANAGFPLLDIDLLTAPQTAWRMPFEKDRWRLDYYLPDNLPVDWLPADAVIHGSENNKNLFVLVAAISNQDFALDAHIAFDLGITRSESPVLPCPPYGVDSHVSHDGLYEMPFKHQAWHLDKGIPAIPDGWAISPIFTGYEGKIVPIICFGDQVISFSFPMKALRPAFWREPKRHEAQFTAQAHSDMGISENYYNLPFQHARWGMDKGIGEIPDGWLVSPFFPGSDGERVPVSLFSGSMRQYELKLPPLSESVA